ncbi:sodium:proton antiporter [Actinocorallia populi]|uniref:sodium:proton antiporter n=1 Tax=Actinocorallia populi TaxID=2079200 RepID=UPI000D08A942|nr:NADH-quinone oxidoreductase subunit K [Actinocorallia populi]
MSAPLLVGVLVAGGVFLVLLPGMVRIVFGFVLLGHAVNVLLVTAGGTGRTRAPLIGEEDPARMADPLPQAFVLTAIVITFGTTVYLLSMIRARSPGGRSEEPSG